MSLQNLTIPKNETDVTAEKCQPFNYAHERYIEWYAAEGQLLWDLESFKVVKRPALAKLARELAVSRQTLYEWPQRITDFEQRVQKAKTEIIQSNAIAVWNAVFLKACTGNMKAAEIYLTNFDPNFVLPSQKATRPQQNSYGLMDLLQLARSRSVQ